MSGRGKAGKGMAINKKIKEDLDEEKVESELEIESQTEDEPDPDSEPEAKADKPKTKAKKTSKKSESEKSEAEKSEDEKPKTKTKRAPSAYNLYIKAKIAELRDSEPGLKPQEYMKKAVLEYNIEHPKPEKEDKPKKERKPRQKKADKTEKDESEKKVKKERKPRAPTAYNLFIKDAMAKLKESEEQIKPQERMKRAVEMWHKLSDDEKQAFKESLVVEQAEE